MSRKGFNPRLRNWCFTINNPTATAKEFSDKVTGHKHFRALVFQLEKGESGTPHWQGYVEFTAPIRAGPLQALVGGRAHLEGRKGTRMQAYDYCTKDEGRLAGPFEFGNFGGNQGKRNDIEDIAEEFKKGTRMDKIASEYPATFVRYHKGLKKLRGHLLPDNTSGGVRVTLFYGPTGVGKTRTVMKMKDVFKKDGTDQWFDGYQGESILLIDDFAGSCSRITLSFLLNVLDRYPCRLPIKGDFELRRCKEIFVTTNIHPRMWYDYSKREEHYRALKRRFHQVIWFQPGTAPHCPVDIALEPKSFWDDWSEFCDETSTFKELEKGFSESSDSEDMVYQTPSCGEDSCCLPTQETQVLTPCYCKVCNYIYDESDDETCPVCNQDK